MAYRRELLGAAIGIVLLWFTTIAVFLIRVSGDNYGEVFIYNGCLGSGSVTVFVFCLLEVIVGAWFLRKHFLPLLFGDKLFESFDSLKKQKLVASIAQIVVRSSCAVQLITILSGAWGPQLTLDTGLFATHNARAAYSKLVKDGISTNCAANGMNHLDVAAIRSWYFTKYHMVAVHLWELAYIPGLTLDVWLHHLFVVLTAAIASQPEALTGNYNEQPLLDTVGFSFILGASMNAPVSMCVVLYHFTAPKYLTQAMWMEGSAGGAGAILIIADLGFPLVFTGLHWKEFGSFTLTLIIVGILFLSFVEARLIIVKRSIARAARRKAEAAALRDELAQSGDALATV